MLLIVFVGPVPGQKCVRMIATPNAGSYNDSAMKLTSAKVRESKYRKCATDWWNSER